MPARYSSDSEAAQNAAHCYRGCASTLSLQTPPLIIDAGPWALWRTCWRRLCPPCICETAQRKENAGWRVALTATGTHLLAIWCTATCPQLVRSWPLPTVLTGLCCRRTFEDLQRAQKCRVSSGTATVPLPPTMNRAENPPGRNSSSPPSQTKRPRYGRPMSGGPECETAPFC